MKVLIVVDMQKDFIDGALGTPEAQAVVPKVADAIRQAADKDTVVIFTKDTHPANYMDTLEGKNLPVPHCIEHTSGWSIVDEVFQAYINVIDEYMEPWCVCNAETNPIRVNKPTFGSIELQDILYTMNSVNEITDITLMGIDTSICVLSNAILCKATLPEVPINVIADCCSSISPETHQRALETMKLCQINVV